MSPSGATLTVQHRIRVVWASAGSVAAALVLVLLLGAWGAYQDGERIRLAIVQAEVTRVRSHAERTAGQIESQLSDLGSHSNLQEAAHATWLRERWKLAIAPPDRLYSAVTDDSGVVLSHSDPPHEGEQLGSDWQSVEVRDVGPGVYETTCPALTGGARALDVVVPIEIGSRQVGSYHAGLSWEWLESRVAEGRWRSLQRWGLVVGGIFGVVLVSSVLLYRITRRAATLENALALAHMRRVGELSQLIVGLAHEIRNPLNAVRLNVFTADRVFRGDVSLGAEEIAVMLGESVREIERVDELITLLLNYARFEPVRSERVDVGRELSAVVQFLKPSLQGNAIEIEIQMPRQALFVMAGRGHLRQVLLNLLGNAREAIGDKGGTIRATLAERNGMVEIEIVDSGTGIRPEDSEHVFQPFFTTKEGGVGLGLAIVRSLVEAAEGTVSHKNLGGGGCSFRVRWPPAKAEPSTRESSAA